jgi:uncharacterized protein (TIGR00730 family)
MNDNYQFKSLCVQCGSSPGFDNIYLKEAIKLGEHIAECGIDLVYGGSDLGLMGAVAKSAFENGAKVTAVITTQLRNLTPELNVSEIIEVATMHERKAKMAELSDAFVALPGGYGTFEEIFESITWSQLNIHHKPCCFYNVNSYYDDLIKFLSNAVNCGFIRSEHSDLYFVANDPVSLINRLKSYRPIIIKKWFD